MARRVDAGVLIQYLQATPNSSLKTAFQGFYKTEVRTQRAIAKFLEDQKLQKSFADWLMRQLTTLRIKDNG